MAGKDPDIICPTANALIIKGTSHIHPDFPVRFSAWSISSTRLVTFDLRYYHGMILKDKK